MALNTQSLDRILSAETTVSSTITVNTAFTLPSAANTAGKLYTIYNPSASTANVLVNASDASLVVTVQPGTAAVVTPIVDAPTTNAGWMVLSNGLNASGLKGDTSGSAKAGGYVGELSAGGGALRSGTGGFTYSTRTSTAIGTADTNVASITLNKGTYIVSALIFGLNPDAAIRRLYGSIRINGTVVVPQYITAVAASDYTTMFFSLPLVISTDSTPVQLYAQTSASGSMTTASHEMWVARIS